MRGRGKAEVRSNCAAVLQKLSTSERLMLGLHSVFAKHYTLIPPRLTPFQAAMKMAKKYERQFKYNEAEQSYLRALELAETSQSRFSCYDDLSRLYELIENYQMALETSIKQSEAAVESGYTWYIGRGLVFEADIYFKMGHLELAVTTMENALADMEEEHLFQKVNKSLRRARISVAKGNLEAAEVDLNFVWPQLEKYYTNSWLCHRFLNQWWAVKAEIEAQRENHTLAVEARWEVAKEAQILSQKTFRATPFAQKEVADALRKLGEAMQIARDDRAAEAFAENREILTRIGLTAHSLPLTLGNPPSK